MWRVSEGAWPRAGREVFDGAEWSLGRPGQGSFRLRIRPGAVNGSSIRIDGKGAPGSGGGPAGDLVIETEVRTHPILRRDGIDLSLTLPVRVIEAAVTVAPLAGEVMATSGACVSSFTTTEAVF